jgi:hypothetical protein
MFRKQAFLKVIVCEYAPPEAFKDNYDKYIVTLDDV